MTDEIPTPITDAGFDAICNNTPPNQRILAVLGMAKKLERERHQLRELLERVLTVVDPEALLERDEDPHLPSVLQCDIESILAATEPKK